MTKVTLPYACTIPDLVNLAQHEVSKSFYSDITTCAVSQSGLQDLEQLFQSSYIHPDCAIQND